MLDRAPADADPVGQPVVDRAEVSGLLGDARRPAGARPRGAGAAVRRRPQRGRHGEHARRAGRHGEVARRPGRWSMPASCSRSGSVPMADVRVGGPPAGARRGPRLPRRGARWSTTSWPHSTCARRVDGGGRCSSPRRCCLVAMTVALAVPSSRETIARWLGFDDYRIERVDVVPPTVTVPPEPAGPEPRGGGGADRRHAPGGAGARPAPRGPGAAGPLCRRALRRGARRHAAGDTRRGRVRQARHGGVRRAAPSRSGSAGLLDQRRAARLPVHRRRRRGPRGPRGRRHARLAARRRDRAGRGRLHAGAGAGDRGRCELARAR